MIQTLLVVLALSLPLAAFGLARERETESQRRSNDDTTSTSDDDEFASDGTSARFFRNLIPRYLTYSQVYEDKRSFRQPVHQVYFGTERSWPMPTLAERGRATLGIFQATTGLSTTLIRGFFVVHVSQLELSVGAQYSIRERTALPLIGLGIRLF